MYELAFRWIVYLFIVDLASAATSNSIEQDLFVNKCGRTKTDYGMLLDSHGKAGEYDFFNRSLICSYTFRASVPYTNVQVEFHWFDVGVRYMDTGSCTTAFMNIYDGMSSSDALLKGPLCGSDRPSLTMTTGDSVTIEVEIDGNSTVLDFRAVLTAYRGETVLGICPSATDDFHCETSKLCISTQMTCLSPNISSCGNQDYSDQSKNDPLSCPYDYVDLIPLWIALAIVAATLPFLMYWCCWRPGYVQWVCCVCRHKSLGGPCELCTRKSRNCLRGLFAGCRGCACCGPRYIADAGDGEGGYRKLSSRKGVYISNYRHNNSQYGYSNSSTPLPLQGTRSPDSGKGSTVDSKNEVRTVHA
ncbi:uncharacterized protein LOC100373498 [Saccoglossus kowalevskii]|uniref:Uncharacterized protein LOC100373498 n=1 Tax=Saccoglossus kowalevskii TaxID=10224 RepID=A0ABM0H1S6_SACKO|nr:PREDICTED: uncharacterized protein LOC100373498 [Saccoglossus kowalevskii]